MVISNFILYVQMLCVNLNLWRYLIVFSSLTYSSLFGCGWPPQKQSKWIFLKAFQRLHTFQGNSKFTTWLFSITRNHCLDVLRSRAVHPQQTSEVLLDEIVDLSREKVSSTLERRETEQLLRTLIRESLDAMENKVLTLHYVHEMPLDTVSRMLGLTNQSGAKAYIVSAKRKLKRAHERWKSRNQIATRGGNRVE